MSPWSRSWLRQVWVTVGLLIAYYAFPVGFADSRAAVLSLALTAAGLGLVGAVLVQELSHLSGGLPFRSTGSLSLLLVVLVMAFSLAFFLLDRVEPTQVAALETRTDALYFTLSTMATVGYGDVHAEGQLARALVCGLIVFNVVVVSSLVRAHLRLRDRVT